MATSSWRKYIVWDWVADCMYESRTTYVSHELVAFAYHANHSESYDVYMRWHWESYDVYMCYYSESYEIYVILLGVFWRVYVILLGVFRCVYVISLGELWHIYVSHKVYMWVTNYAWSTPLVRDVHELCIWVTSRIHCSWLIYVVRESPTYFVMHTAILVSASPAGCTATGSSIVCIVCHSHTWFVTYLHGPWFTYIICSS